MTLEVSANNVRLERMLFLPGIRVGVDDFNDYQSFEDTVSAAEVTQSERMTVDLVAVVQSLMRQVCWSFWQATDPFPAERLDQYIAGIVRDMGVR